MTAALAGALTIASACTPEDEGGFGMADTAYGTVDVPARAATTLAVTLSDENIIALLDTTYDALIELGGLAMTHSKHTRVRELASQAIERHRILRSENLTLARSISASPKLADDDPIQGHHQAMEQLRLTNGPRFDAQYVERTITMHEALLDEVREALDMPLTGTVKEHLTRVATALESDLTHAQAVKQEIRG